ncbi:MAG: hypothetical protein KY475_06375 [Planctomycetes bacterium]|nr:hypothetical protein [Planctomycetota bacterium]
MNLAYPTTSITPALEVRLRNRQIFDPFIAFLSLPNKRVRFVGFLIRLGEPNAFPIFPNQPMTTGRIDDDFDRLESRP